jgi:hypothetical protein
VVRPEARKNRLYNEGASTEYQNTGFRVKMFLAKTSREEGENPLKSTWYGI